MRVKGLEPPRRETPDPKSGASANSATPAHIYHFLATLYMPLTTEFILQDICFFVNRVYTIFLIFFHLLILLFFSAKPIVSLLL